MIPLLCIALLGTVLLFIIYLWTGYFLILAYKQYTNNKFNLTKEQRINLVGRFVLLSGPVGWIVSFIYLTMVIIESKCLQRYQSIDNDTE